MRIATCRWNGGEYVAIDEGASLGLLPGGGPTLKQYLASGQPLRLLHDKIEARVPQAEVEFLCPIPDAAKIICVGMNYPSHAGAGAAPPRYPSLFIRFNNSQVGHGQPVRMPAISAQLDFEGELAVIVGRRVRRVSAQDALACVAGYSCFAENSVRDFQAHARQATAGKNFLGSGAFGPWLATADEVDDVARLQLTSRLNGEIVQQDSVGNMIFSVAELIAYITQFTELEPGDVIVTGTPDGVGFTRQPPLWLRAGDVFEVDIAKVGRLRNAVAVEDALDG